MRFPEYSERAIFLPQCLRSDRCRASRGEYGFVHYEGCGQRRKDGLICPILRMIEIAVENGYKRGNIYIASGGSGIISFFRERGLPKGILGVACEKELKEGLARLADINVDVAVQTAVLLKDGCSETMLFENSLEEEWKRILTKYFLGFDGKV